MWALDWTPLGNGVLNLIILILQLVMIIGLGVVVTRMSRHISRMDRELARMRIQRDEAQRKAEEVLERSLAAAEAEVANGTGTSPAMRPVTRPRRHLWLVPPTLMLGLTGLTWRRVRRLNHHHHCECEACPHGPKSYQAARGGVVDTVTKLDASKPSGMIKESR